MVHSHIGSHCIVYNLPFFGHGSDEKSWTPHQKLNLQLRCHDDHALGRGGSCALLPYNGGCQWIPVTARPGGEFLVCHAAALGLVVRGRFKSYPAMLGRNLFLACVVHGRHIHLMLHIGVESRPGSGYALG